MFQVQSGKIEKAKKVVIYGPEGIGKSTLASKFPSPVFIDTEGSTSALAVDRLPKPTSWEMLKEEIKFAVSERKWKTLVIDTIDWAERLCSDALCQKFSKNGIEDFGYGNGFTYMNEEIGRLLDLLNSVIDHGMNVVLTAHSQIIKFEQPDEVGAYDRYELKLGIKKTEKRTAALVKEWTDMVLFINYKTLSVATDKDGKKHKASGGKRVIYASHHPCWDAKNRFGLPDEMPCDFSTIAHLFKNTPFDALEEDPVTIEVKTDEDIERVKQVIDELVETDDEPMQIEMIEDDSDDIPQVLKDLMNANDVSEEEIRKAVSDRGYYPYDTPISNYADEFIKGCLIGAWEQMLNYIKNIKE